jgi:hypothetical protein
MSNAQLKARLYLACLLVLAAGLCSAALIYVTATEEEADSGGNYIVVDGVAHPVAPQLSKRYVRTLEQFGGKAAVLFDEIDRWFSGLWHGRALAATVACLSTVVAAALFLFAAWLPGERKEDSNG